MKYLKFLSLLFFSCKVYSTQISVNFEVDASALSTINTNNELDIGIRGNPPYFQWHRSTIVLQGNKGDHVYKGKIELDIDTSETIEFKFIAAKGRIWEEEKNRTLKINPENKHYLVKTKFNTPIRKQNPFKKFIGKWKFDKDGFNIIWDGENLHNIAKPTEEMDCKEINHDRSLLCTISDSADIFTRGHILWTYDQSKNRVSWLSSFFPSRNGVGEGTVDEHGNLRIKAEFQDEPEGTYRIYHWSWDSNQNFSIKSIQYDQNNDPTGNWYGGGLVRTNLSK